MPKSHKRIYNLGLIILNIMFKIYNEKNILVNTKFLEVPEQKLAKQYIRENDVVLELGARYGSVSCIINSKLNNKKNQVVVEPDDRVWNALENNKKINNCQFNIVKGFISEKKLGLTNLDTFYGGYGATSIFDISSSIPNYTLSGIKTLYNITDFNVLVADCEGFLETFLDENPIILEPLRLIIFEEDYPEKCNYNKIKNNLIKQGFIEIEKTGQQNVWGKNTSI
jgi:FkbM family methyltransferase